jgi:hypothetical protein
LSTLNYDEKFSVRGDKPEKKEFYIGDMPTKSQRRRNRKLEKKLEDELKSW